VLTPRRVGLLFIPLIFEEIMVGHGVTTICLTADREIRPPGPQGVHAGLVMPHRRRRR